MTKSAPGWGKTIGIIMICLGGFGVFYQLYKIIIPLFLNNFPRKLIEHSAEMNNDHNADRALEGFNMIAGDENQMTAFLIFGILGILLSVPYIIAGAKLLTAKPQNYNLAKYVLIVFIAYNVIGSLLIFTGDSGFFIKLILIYGIIGLVFDIALLIILLSCDKSAYGIGEGSEIRQSNDTLYKEIDEEIL